MENRTQAIEAALRDNRVARLELYSIPARIAFRARVHPDQLPKRWSDSLIKKEPFIEEPLVRGLLDGLKRHRKHPTSDSLDVRFGVVLIGHSGERIFSLFSNASGRLVYLNGAWEATSPALLSWITQTVERYFPS